MSVGATMAASIQEWGHPSAGAKSTCLEASSPLWNRGHGGGRLPIYSALVVWKLPQVNNDACRRGIGGTSNDETWLLLSETKYLGSSTIHAPQQSHPLDRKREHQIHRNRTISGTPDAEIGGEPWSPWSDGWMDGWTLNVVLGWLHA